MWAVIPCWGCPMVGGGVVAWVSRRHPGFSYDWRCQGGETTEYGMRTHRIDLSVEAHTGQLDERAVVDGKKYFSRLQVLEGTPGFRAFCESGQLGYTSDIFVTTERGNAVEPQVDYGLGIDRSTTQQLNRQKAQDRHMKSNRKEPKRSGILSIMCSVSVLLWVRVSGRSQIHFKSWVLSRKRI